MPAWTAKDPDAVLDYTYRIRLDAGDSIAPGDYTFTKLSGDVVIDSHALAALPTTDEDGIYGQVVTVWLSGGTDGETAVFEATWSTVGGRDDDDHITIAIVDDPSVLAYTDYAKPSPSDLIARYPAFAAVATTTIQYWLTDAERMVDTSWLEGDYAVGLMSLAAHNMTLIGLGAGATAAAAAAGASGYKVMRSGALTLERFEDSSSSGSAGTASTSYGSEFAALLRRNKAGPRVMPTGAWPVPAGYPYGPF